jgi:hypothetical protein
MQKGDEQSMVCSGQYGLAVRWQYMNWRLVKGDYYGT